VRTPANCARRFARRIIAEERALLVCAGGGIGDALLATVVARALHGRYVCVDVLAKPVHRPALERVTDVAAIYADDSDDAALVADLASRPYACAVVTWATARNARIPYAARIPVRVGQSRRLYSARFTHRVTVRSELGDVMSHWSDILLDYARALGCDTSNRVPSFVPTGQDENRAQALLRSLQMADGDFAIVHPANAIAAERGIWPTRGWSQLVRVLRERLGVPVLVTGTGIDREICAAVAGENGLSVAGSLDIGAFGALCARARAFAGITTGAMHVAAAVGAPTVGVFPFQSDTPERWAPLGRRTAVVRASYPCPAGEVKETCPDYACVAHLDVDRIVAAVEALQVTASA